MNTIDFDFLINTIKPRPYNSHKGSMGCLFSICGSYGMAGAQILCCNGTLRSGIGLLKTAVVDSIYPIVASNVFEAVFTPLKDNGEGTFSYSDISKIMEVANSAKATLIGCGLGVTEDTEKILCHLVRNYEKPLLIDADGINCLSKHIHILDEKSCQIVLTPHPGEMNRLTGLSIKEVEENRQRVAEEFSKKYGVVTVLKGADTIVTDGENTYISYAGNAGMATGGSGDVLSGIIGSFLAQGYSPLNSGCIGVFAHGKAGDFAREELGETSMLPRDVINYLSRVFKTINK